MRRRVTVCQLRTAPEGAFAADWAALTAHARDHGSDLVLLPEMIFGPWLAVAAEPVPARWADAVAAHRAWLGRLGELAPAAVIGSRPVTWDGVNHNAGFAWSADGGARDVHVKYYLPEEPGFWEARWYQRAPRPRFDAFDVAGARAGMMICTDLWFAEHARAYGRQGAHLIVNPRATDAGTADKWIAGGRAIAVMAGAYCLSSNHAGPVNDRLTMAGAGWIIDPNGEVLGVTSEAEPFITREIDLGAAERAKATYPRYVRE